MSQVFKLIKEKELDDTNIYEEEALDLLMDNDEISSSEAGFMQGFSRFRF